MRRALLALMLGLALPVAGSAEPVRVSATGAVPVAADATGSGALRQAALADAVARAVDGYALQLLTGSDAPSGASDAAALDAVLGTDRREYTTRFRIAQVLGVREPRLVTGPGAEAEFAVAAEVWVDAERLRRTLASAGLLAAAEPRSGPSQRLLLVLDPLESHAAFALVREELGAVPLELSQRRAVLALETDRDPAAVVETLRRAAPEGMSVEAWREPGQVRLQIRGEPLPASKGLTP
jgi:hypothetical protein